MVKADLQSALISLKPGSDSDFWKYRRRYCQFSESDPGLFLRNPVGMA
jgi:hypothetical protein